MKRSYILIAGVIVAVIIIVVVAMVLVSSDKDKESETAEQAQSTDVEYLEEMQLNPTDNYIEELENIILNDSDPYVRERGIFTLTDIALREGDTDQIVDFLKEIAYDDEDENVRTAAYANVDLIRKVHPLPQRGSLQLSIAGEIEKGSTISLIANIKSSIDVNDAIVGIEKLHKDIECLSSPITNVKLQANESKTFKCELKLNETGTYVLPVTLMLSFDRVDSETIQQEIHLTVTETDGEYYFK